mgnify:FL=1
MKTINFISNLLNIDSKHLIMILTTIVIFVILDIIKK